MAFIGKNAVHCWCKFDGSGNVASTATGYNVSSAADNGEGDYTINFTTNFVDAHYCQATGSDNGSNQLRVNCRHTQAVGSYRFITKGSSDNTNDPGNGMISFFGNQ
tara:strand:+ start:105 stop:422 length:318 start_codon:yes stop_codon:yes gene_type:complete